MKQFLLVVLMIGLSSVPGRAQGDAADLEPTFKSGARVRAQVSIPGVDERKWFTGIASADVEGCGLLVLDDVRSAHATRDGKVLVAVQDALALQLSSLYDGHIDPETFRQRNYSPGKSIEGERWINVPIDSLKAADPDNCPGPRGALPNKR